MVAHCFLRKWFTGPPWSSMLLDVVSLAMHVLNANIHLLKFKKAPRIREPPGNQDTRDTNH